jgi:alkanesulfonate monooxygenase SsuD/methylene tetrahydromethanopterin reductase-like flavin-dependent oxidoreductase (luciferase family)
MLGGPHLSTADRVERFQEFVELLIRLRTEDHVDANGRWFSARNARTLPPPTSSDASPWAYRHA